MMIRENVSVKDNFEKIRDELWKNHDADSKEISETLWKTVVCVCHLH